MTEQEAAVPVRPSGGPVTAVADKVDALMNELREPLPDPSSINDIGDRMLDLISHEPDSVPLLLQRKVELETLLDQAKIGMAAVMGRLFAYSVLMYAPSEDQPTPNVRFAHEGPAGEIALAALHLLRHAGTIVPLDTEDGALGDPSDPDFTDYQRVFRTAVAHISSAAYYLLDPEQSRAALLSSPPDLEAFPPLPFPRVWIEMTHLTPLLRLTGDQKEQGRYIDLLGVAIAEIEQGRVWDIYLPFQFSDASEFFFVGGRVAPNTVIAHDSELKWGDLTFSQVRRVALGVTHLITARNAPPQPLTLPRQQRRRLEREGHGQATSSRLYYVDLHEAGEHGTSSGGREYHVRWLVRGHWRHSNSGRTFCTCCDPAQIASWVAPYIKGPVGAPWKGHQIRRAGVRA